MAKVKHHCPNCGVEMNHHADKVNEVILLQTSEALGEDFNGVIEAVYACPTCGDTIKTTKPQSTQSETPNVNYINTEYRPRTGRRLRFTYTGLL